MSPAKEGGGVTNAQIEQMSQQRNNGQMLRLSKRPAKERQNGQNGQIATPTAKPGNERSDRANVTAPNQAMLQIRKLRERNSLNQVESQMLKMSKRDSLNQRSCANAQIEQTHQPQPTHG